MCLAGCQRYRECVSRDDSVLASVSCWMLALEQVRLAGFRYSECVSLDVSVIAGVSRWMSAL